MSSIIFIFSKLLFIRIPATYGYLKNNLTFFIKEYIILTIKGIMKPCKSCNKIIARSAKTCPHCGAQIHHSFGFVLKLVIVIVALNVFTAIIIAVL